MRDQDLAEVEQTMIAPRPCSPTAGGRQLSGITRGKVDTSAFTLVELLAVIIIITLVAVFILPSIGSLSKSSSRRTAVSLAMAALDQARTQALAQSGTCYFVIANGDTHWPENYRYRAFAFYREEYLPASQQFVETLIGQWTPLPDGIAFKPDTAAVAGTTPSVPTIFSAPLPTGSPTFYCHPAGTSLTLPFFKFNTVGSLDQPTDPKYAQIKLFEGYVDVNGNPIATNTSKSAADETITVSLFTGRAKRLDPGETISTNATN